MVTDKKYKMLTILYLQGTSRMGGAPESLYLIAKGLPNEKFEPLVVCSENNKLTEKLANEGINYTTINMGMWRKGKNIPLIPISILRLYRLCKTKNVSLIHANSLWDAPYASLAAKLFKIPCVVHIRTEQTVEKANKYLLKYADSIITISDSLKKPFEISPEIHSKITTIYNGLDIKPYQIAREQKDKSSSADKKCFTIGYIGRIDPLKGLSDLLSAFSILGGYKDNAKLVFVGDITGKQEEYYRALKTSSEVLNISNQVIFTGFLDNVLETLMTFDILILPSLREGFGRVLIEAMAAGVPVIGTRVGGIPEIIDDKINGFIVPPDDPKSLKEAIIKLMKDKDLCKIFSAEGLKKVKERFTIERNIKEIVSLYEKLLN